MYEFNSFIELSTYGGHVSILNSKFSSMNTCGSILRNKDFLFSRNDISPLTNYPNVYKYRVNNYQYDLLTKYKYGFANPFTGCNNAPTSASPCYSVSLVGSTFSNFGSTKTGPAEAVFVDPANKMKYSGVILDESKLKLSVNKITIYRKGLPVKSLQKRLSNEMK